MKISLLLLPVVLVSGCASTSVSEFKSPDGMAIKKVKCTSDPTKCFAMASDSCSKEGTYRVISSQSNAGGFAADIIPGPITWYAMNFACGPSDGKMPDFKFVGQQYIPPLPPPPPAQPIVIQRQSTSTNCTRFGDTVNCTTN